MIILNKDNIETYRYAIGKICFLRAYNEYKLVEDYPYSNCFKLINTETEKTIVMALFTYVSPEKYPKDELIIAYQRNPNKKKRDRIRKYILLSKEFNDMYNQRIVDALMSPNKIVEAFSDDEKMLLAPLVLDMNNSTESEGMCYKYLSEDTVINDKYDVNTGSIGFANPAEFNDPFDCNCVFQNNTSLSDCFRIFCVAPTNDNILMWSYYSTNHKGFCMEYKREHIIDVINSSMKDGICIVGKVEYKNNRPKQRARSNNINYTEIMFYINAAFTKYSEWNHEREYRFVLLSDSFSSAQSYVTFNVPLIQIYGGCKCSTTSVNAKKTGAVLRVHKLDKHPTEYRLTP